MWNFKKITLIWDYGSQNICKSSSSSCRILFNFLILLHPVSGSRFSNYVSFMNEKRRRREKKVASTCCQLRTRKHFGICSCMVMTYCSFYLIPMLMFTFNSNAYGNQSVSQSDNLIMTHFKACFVI